MLSKVLASVLSCSHLLSAPLVSLQATTKPQHKQPSFLLYIPDQAGLTLLKGCKIRVCTNRLPRDGEQGPQSKALASRSAQTLGIAQCKGW